MYNAKFLDYVPEPDPVTTDKIIAVHYYPGWVKGGTDIHHGFADLEDYPERCPVLGYYDESNPEVTDWEIKWAVENGINCFIYCWYRYKENEGKPVTREALRLGHAIHEGLFQARYQRYIKFAIMFENQAKRWGNAADEDDLIHNLLPWWAEQYFSKQNYLKIDGKPVLYIYQTDDFINSFGGTEEACVQAIARLDAEIKKYGFPGIHVSARSSGTDTRYRKTLLEKTKRDLSYVDILRRIGFSSAFQYGWEFIKAELTPEEFNAYAAMPDPRNCDANASIRCQMQKIRERAEYAPDFFMFTASIGREKSPWRKYFPFDSLPASEMGTIVSMLYPEAFRKLLCQIKEVVDALPAGSIGRSIVVLDAWNEWGEGHFISPCCGSGFKYLQAIREVFSSRDNLPDYRVPQILDFNGYDYQWKK
jgi:hypothetical protein